jgi:cAMP-dependent protein kinase regulator
MSRLATRILSLLSGTRSSSTRASPHRAFPGMQRARLHPLGEPRSTSAPLPFWTRLYPAGGVIVREGEPGDSMFVIVTGQVAVMREPEGRPGWGLGQLGGGSFFGELSLLTGGPRTASVMALDRTVLLELSHAGVREAGARYGVGDAVLRLESRKRLQADAFRVSPLLATLPPETQALLGSAFVPRAVEAGESILTRGQPNDALYVLLRGRCAVLHTHPEGGTSSYPDLEEGAVFGEVSLLRGQRATATVKALTRCTLLRVDRDAFKPLLRGQRALSDALVKLGLERLHRTLRVMANAHTMSGNVIRAARPR